jgi:hypothetical protein
MDNENAIVMEEELKNLIFKIEDIQKDIHDYIVNTEHYIFNWIGHEEVQDFIKEYPDEYEDMIHIQVANISDVPTIRIYFEDHPDDIEYINRYAILSTFRHETKARWLEWNGKLKERQISSKEREVQYLKEQLETAEKELEQLKNNE